MATKEFIKKLEKFYGKELTDDLKCIQGLDYEKLLLDIYENDTEENKKRFLE